MATDIRFKRGTTAKVEAYTPLVGEPVFDIEKKRLYIGTDTTREEIGGDTFSIEDDTLDDINDGTTYGKVANLDLTSNRIDFDKLSGVDTTTDEINELHNAGCIQADFIKLHTLTATAAEINYLDNDNLTAADLTKLADITASAAELNQLDDVSVGGNTSGDIVTTDDTQTLTGKTLTSPKINEDVVLSSTATELNQLDGVTVGGTSAGDIVTINDTQTLTGKTLTSPKINENVVLSSTATELNQLDGVSVGGNTSGDIVVVDSTQTLTYKIIDADNNTISNLVHGSEVDNPSSGIHGVTGSVVGSSDTQTLTGKTLTSPKINEDVVLSSTATELNQLDGVTVGGTSAGDIATINDTQTLTGKTLTSPKINEDVVLSSTATELNQLDDVSVGGNTSGDIVTTDDTQTLTGKTIDADNSTISNLAHGAEVDNPSSGIHGVTGNVVGTSDTQTLTSKTLTSPKINEDVVLSSTATELNQLDGVTVGGTSAGDIATINGTQTLTGKTINADNNTISNLAHGAEVDNPTVAHGATGAVVGTTNSQVLTNKTFTDNVTYFQDNSDNSKKFQIDCSGISGSTTRTLTAPDANGTMMLTTDTPAAHNHSFSDITSGDIGLNYLEFSGSTYASRLYTTGTGNLVYFYPQTTDQVYLYVGGDSNIFKQIYINGEDIVKIQAVKDANNHAYVNANTATSIFASVGIKDSGNEHLYYFTYSALYPVTPDVCDLGAVGGEWQNVYTLNAPTVGDFFHLDTRIENGLEIEIDDIAVIESIKSGNKHDPITGMMLIDDNTIPEWLKFKNRKTGVVEYNKNGKPYLDLKTLICLNQGAIRQLNRNSIENQEVIISKLNKLEERLNSLER